MGVILQKSAEAFRTISEVAAEIDVPKHVLRFWEGKFAQLKPMKRGGGRRYYRPEDIDLLKGIRQLLYGNGYTIKGVQKLLRDNGVDFVKNCWRGEGEYLAQIEGPHIPDLALEAARHAAEPAKPINVESASSGGDEIANTDILSEVAGGDETDRVDVSEQLRSVLEDLEACRKLIQSVQE